jgi:hypothetical protein
MNVSAREISEAGSGSKRTASSAVDRVEFAEQPARRLSDRPKSGAASVS